MNKHTILWADDDPDELMLMREVLHHSHHDVDVVEVDNGKKALQYLLRHSSELPCLVVLDINMPVLNGRDAVVEMKKYPMLESVPVIIYTTSSSPSDKAFCEKHGIRMITKPQSFDMLKRVVNDILCICTH